MKIKYNSMKDKRDNWSNYFIVSTLLPIDYEAGGEPPINKQDELAKTACYVMLTVSTLSQR